MKKTFIKGIGFGALGAMALMFSLLLFSCEKITPIEELELGDPYQDGIVVFVEPGEWVEVMSMEDLGPFLFSEVPGKADEFRAEYGSEWNVPNFTYMKHIMGTLNVPEDIWYWYQNPDGALHLVNAHFGNNGIQPTRTDDGLPHWLRMHRKIYL